MSRLYDALQNAQTATLPPPPTSPALRAQPLADDGPMLRLSQAIDSRLAERPRRIIQVIGCSPLEDSSTLSKRLVGLSAVLLRRSVLLLDAMTPPSAPGPVSHAHPAVPGLAAIHAFAAPHRSRPVEDNPYAQASLFDQTEEASVDPDQLTAAWDRLRIGYDLVVIDSPPASTPLGLALAPTVDGVILVIEAEKTRNTQAQAARDALLAGGANILGVVLDKRRYWVPRGVWDLV
jgi:hypothetical protein